MLRLILFLLLLSSLSGCFFPSERPLQTAEQAPAETPSAVAPSPQELTESVAEFLAAEPEAGPLVVPEIWNASIEGSPEPVAGELTEPEQLPYHGDFPLASHPRVDRLRDYYTGSGHKMFGRWLERAARYVPKIQQVFASEGIPLDLAYLAMIESGFNNKAYSWAHAAGPWQFIESTGRIYGLNNDWWQDQRCDIEKATHAAAKHLKYLYKRFDGDWYLAVAAYNAGGGKVRKAIKAQDSRNFWELTEGKVLREETRNYLPKLIASLEIVRDLEKFGFADLDYDPPIEYETVTIPTSTDLEIVAEFCGADYAEIKELNPELKRWSTPPGVRDYQLKVPYGAAEQFNALYAELPEDQRARYHRHQIKKGDTLRALARKYRIQVDDIIALNNIRNPRALKLGTDLILPLKEGFTTLPVNELADSYVRSRRRTYTVRSGDSLWKIAKRFSVTEKQLRVWNKLGWSNLLRPGQLLAVSKPGAVKIAKSSRKKGPAKKMIYQVQPGDTLWGIGRQFDVATDEIRSWNELTNGHILRPGQKLTLMVPTTGQG